MYGTSFCSELFWLSAVNHAFSVLHSGGVWSTVCVSFSRCVKWERCFEEVNNKIKCQGRDRIIWLILWKKGEWTIYSIYVRSGSIGQTLGLVLWDHGYRNINGLPLPRGLSRRKKSSKRETDFDECLFQSKDWSVIIYCPDQQSNVVFRFIVVTWSRLNASFYIRDWNPKFSVIIYNLVIRINGVFILFLFKVEIRPHKTIKNTRKYLKLVNWWGNHRKIFCLFDLQIWEWKMRIRETSTRLRIPSWEHILAIEQLYILLNNIERIFQNKKEN